MNKLPDELWLKVFSYLSPKGLKQSCLVSRSFREIASVFLFTSIDIFVGHFPLPFEHDDDIATSSQLEQGESVTKAALDKLIRLHGQETPALAPLVVNFRVVASTEHKLVFERYHIRSALKKLTSLQRFEWIGKPLPLDIADELVASRPNISSLCLSHLDSIVAESLAGLTELSELRLIDTNKSSAAIGLECGPDTKSLNALLSTNAGHLRSLSLNGEVAWRASLLRVADNLTLFAVSNAGDCQGLDLFLRHARNLESLTLLDLRTLGFLSANADEHDMLLLPKLQDLRVQLDSSIIGGAAGRNLLEDAYILENFVTMHKHLLRCDFSLWPNAPGIVSQSPSVVGQDNEAWFTRIAFGMYTLQFVSAVGLSFPRTTRTFMEMMLRGLLERLPGTCTCLRLSGVTEVSFDIFLSYMNVVRPLTFLSLSNSRPLEYCEPKHSLPTINDLLDMYHMDNLQAVCLGNDIFDIDREQEGDKRGVKWPEEKVRFRKESDFRSTDAHWLMSYCSVSKYYDFSGQPPEEINGMW